MDKVKPLNVERPFIGELYCEEFPYRPKPAGERKVNIPVSKDGFIMAGSLIRSAVKISCYGPNLENEPRYLSRQGNTLLGGPGLSEIIYFGGGIAILIEGNPSITLMHETFSQLESLAKEIGITIPVPSNWKPK